MANANDPLDELALSLRRWERPDTTLRLVETPSDELATVHGELDRVVESLAQERVRLQKGHGHAPPRRSPRRASLTVSARPAVPASLEAAHAQTPA